MHIREKTPPVPPGVLSCFFRRGGSVPPIVEIAGEGDKPCSDIQRVHVLLPWFSDGQQGLGGPMNLWEQTPCQAHAEKRSSAWHSICSGIYGVPDSSPWDRESTHSSRRMRSMLRLALLFLIIALIAGALGLFHVQFIASEIAWVLFVVFLVLFLVSLVFGGWRRSPPYP